MGSICSGWPTADNGGMSGPRWYVAYVHSCQERKVAERLALRGVESYVPVQKVRRQWSDRVKLTDKVVLPGHVFIRCDEPTRLSLLGSIQGICYFLIDKTCSPRRKVLTVPDSQMADFIRVVNALNGEESDLEIVGSAIAQGDTVRVIRGPLTGFVCECVEVLNSHRLAIRLGLLGTALLSIDIKDVVKE